MHVLYLLRSGLGRLILFFATRTFYRVWVIGRDSFDALPPSHRRIPETPAPASYPSNGLV
jgi:hypothetical protein